MAVEEGYIKFNLQWERTPQMPFYLLKDIIDYRNKCFEEGYIGSYNDTGIGYGNISKRLGKSDHFIISGTQTGQIPVAGPKHFTTVIKVDFEENLVMCEGPIKASAESLTHAVFYQLDKEIQCVIHIHNRAMWDKYRDELPTSSPSIPYGTVEICHEVERLYQSTELREEKILVMGGHKEGIITFGDSFEEAFDVLKMHEI